MASSKERSPNYPAVSLTEAIESVRRYFAAEGRTVVDAATAAAALGYSTLSGAARSKLGAMKQYGLLQGRSDEICVTDLGLRLAIPSSNEEFAAALREAALSPELFRSLRDTHLQASEIAIVAYLIRTRGFTAEGAKVVARRFREAVETADLTSEAAPVAPAPPLQIEQQEASPPAPPVPPESQTVMPLSAEVGTSLELNVPFGRTALRVVVISRGERLTARHIARVRQYLELAEQDLQSVNVENDQPRTAGEGSSS